MTIAAAKLLYAAGGIAYLALAAPRPTGSIGSDARLAARLSAWPLFLLAWRIGRAADWLARNEMKP